MSGLPKVSRITLPALRGVPKLRMKIHVMSAKVVCSSLLVSLVVLNFLAMSGLDYTESSSSPRSHSLITFARERTTLPSSIWAKGRFSMKVSNCSTCFSSDDVDNLVEVCSSILCSRLNRAVHARSMGDYVFVATDDVPSMGIRDSVILMTILLKYCADHPWLRILVHGVIKRNAFNIVQDPYATSYEEFWVNPMNLPLRDRVLGRGGFVSTRSYDLSCGAYFLVFLYDYFLNTNVVSGELFLRDPLIFDAVSSLINLWIAEQNHDNSSTYRYFELPNEGKGSPTVYTGMIWSGFRPSRDMCKYGYLIPANIHAAAALERVLILNDKVWQDKTLEIKASRLLREIENGINAFGMIVDENSEPMYAYEVDGLGNVLDKFDDTHMASLLAVPMLGWSGYNKRAYENTRAYLLSNSNHIYGRDPTKLVGRVVMLQALSNEGPDFGERVAKLMHELFKNSAFRGHGSSQQSHNHGLSRADDLYSQLLIVGFVESVLDKRCAQAAFQLYGNKTSEKLQAESQHLPHKSNELFTVNNPWNPLFYNRIESTIHFE